MTSPNCFALFFALTLAGADLYAQDQASTLAALSQRAQIIAQVRVLEFRRDDRGETRVTMQSYRTIKGTNPGRFELHEPGARACGRALYGLLPGQTYVAFLDSGSDGPKLAVSSARSLAAALPGLLIHLDRLLAAHRETDVVAVLAEGLASKSPRVAEDSALALPLHGALTTASHRARAQIAAALADSLGKQDRRLFSLMQSAARLGLPGALPGMLDSYLEHQSKGLGRALSLLLPRFDADELVPALERAYLHDPEPAKRILTLLDRLPAQRTRKLLLMMTKDLRRSVILEAGVCLLHGGLGESNLTARIGPELTEVCVTRAAPKRPEFRTVLRGESAEEYHRN